MKAIPIGSQFASNARKSKDAADASKKAEEVAGQTSAGTPESHRLAASAHWDAAYKHRDAGNETRAQAHEKQAKVHSEKASSGERAQGFANNEADIAEKLSRQAELARFGKDDKDPRTEKELHQDAAEAHSRAGKAFEMAGDDRAKQFHEAKAGAHADYAAGMK